jgi:hypothetical protein
LFYEVVPG